MEAIEIDAVEDFTCFKILEGKFKGITFHYKTVKIDNDQEPPVLSFNYEIVDYGMLNNGVNKEEFERAAAQILLYLINFNLTVGEEDERSS